MIFGLALGWVLGIGTAILLLQFAAAALADQALEELTDQDRSEPDRSVWHQRARGLLGCRKREAR